MRIARALLAGAALSATVLLAAPAAHAEDGADRPVLTWEQKQAKAASPEGQQAWQEKQARAAAEEAGEAADDAEAAAEPAAEHPRPTGGVHAGGGGTAPVDGPGAAAFVLLSGGVAAGAVMLRRRRFGAAAL
ncbi:hypothetical protein AB0K43_24770 [Kitasatospora sp. NPDC049258]|uniref:hypothetical protein n=1 Tax=Kitasatospora sp. NPDC049258 TaxID=3155394 RepID=UPI003438EE20